MKIGVVLSGCGVFDGSEVTETVSVLIALEESGAEAVCLAPDIPQHHVIHHLNGEAMEPARNVLTESARIARGDITAISEATGGELDGLIIPGGFGAAKNLCSWAVDGPDATVNPDVAALIREMAAAGKPVAALCVAPVVVAKALQDQVEGLVLSLGNCVEPSPYEINGFHQGLKSIGVTPRECQLGDIVVDEANKVITSPCYMMEATPVKILAGVRKAVSKLVEMADSKDS